MWTIWVPAYLVAMSNSNWYRAYDHTAGTGLRPAIDQQIAAGVLWGIAGACFIPLIFWNLMQWLRSVEDPDEELHAWCVRNVATPCLPTQVLRSLLKNPRERDSGRSHNSKHAAGSD
jgi:hypothetical protein